MAVQVDLAKLLASNPRPTAVANDLSERGDFSRKANSGLFANLFDLLGRTSHASATAVGNATDNDSSTTFLGGLKSGITGESKTNYSDVLADRGIAKGPAGAVLGFAGDVLLDPLTYLTVDFTKGLSKSAAEIAAAKTVSEEGALAVAKKAAELQAANPTNVYLKFAGKKISPQLNLPSLGVTEAVQGTTLAKGFSRAAELPLGLAERSRIFEGGSAGKFSSHLRGVKEVFQRNLTPEERRDIALAIEQGKPLSNVPLIRKNGEKVAGFRGGAMHPEGFVSLEEYRQLAMKQMRDMFESERDFGLLTDDQFRANYVPHFFKKPPKDVIPGKIEEVRVGAVGPNKETFMKKRSRDIPLEEAESLGYEPVTDIAEMLEIRSAKHHRVVGRAAFVKDAVDNFGVKLTPKNKQYLKDNNWYDAGKALADSPMAERFKGTYLPEPVVKALHTTDRVLRDGTTGAEFMNFYDKAMRQWKFFNTAVNPGYHIRNTFTDALMNFADGVVNPKYYSQARRILADKQVNTTAEILGAVDNLAPANEFITKVNIGGKKLTSKQVWEAYVGSGAKSGFVQTELQRSTNEIERKGIARQLSHTKAKMGDAADAREDFFRLAHYLHAMDQEFPKHGDFLKASEQASKRVRKFNIDYGSLSSTERTMMNRVIPFYSFMRKNLPLQMELLFTKPGFMAAYPKGQDLAQGVLGTNSDEGEPMIPDWIRNAAPVRVALAKEEANNPLTKFIKKIAGAEEGESVFVPTVGGLTPLQDLANVAEPLNQGATQGPMAGIKEGFSRLVNMATPVIKAPVELATGESLYTGAKIDNWTQWLTSQAGPTRNIYNATSGGNASKLLSPAIGIPFQTSTKERQLGELRRREDIFTQQASASVENDPRFIKFKQMLEERNLPQNIVDQMLSSLKSRLASPETLRTRLGVNQMRRVLEG